MHDLEAAGAEAGFTEAAQPLAAHELRLLRAGEMKEAQRDETRAVGNAHQQRAAPPEHDFRQLDLAFDDGTVAVAQRADRDHARAVFVTQRQVKQHVLHRVQAELRQQFGERGPDAAQRRDGTFGEQGGRVHA